MNNASNNKIHINCVYMCKCHIHILEPLCITTSFLVLTLPTFRLNFYVNICSVIFALPGSRYRVTIPALRSVTTDCSST